MTSQSHMTYSMLKHRICLFILPFISSIAHAQWQIVDTDLNCSYNAIHFLDESTGFVVGNCGQNQIIIKKTSDYGQSWQTVHQSVSGWIYDIYFPTETTGYASTQSNVLKTIDGGELWGYPNPEFEGYPYRSIVFENELIGFGCSADGGAAFARTFDGGINWLEDYQYGGRELIKTGDCEIRMISGNYRKSDNCWEDFQTQFVDVGARTITNFSYIDETHMLACGTGYDETTQLNFGFVSNSEDDGLSWTTTDLNQLLALRSIVSVNENVSYCVGEPHEPFSSSFLKSIDGGQTWSYQEFEFPCATCFTVNVTDIDCVSEKICYAIDNLGNIYRTTNGGGDLYPLHLDDISKQNFIQLSPNPTSSELILSSSIVMIDMSVYDMLGNLCYTHSIKSTNSAINIDSLMPGHYLCKVLLDNNIISILKFVKM